DIFVRVIRSRPNIRVGVAAARQDVWRTGIRSIHAGAFVIFIPALEINAPQGGLSLRRLVPRIREKPATAARQEVARVANVLVPVTAFQLSRQNLAPLERIVVIVHSDMRTPL